MDISIMRRSGRVRYPPIKFWDFEKPDLSAVHEISYNISQLTQSMYRRYPEHTAKKNIPKKDAKEHTGTAKKSIPKKDAIEHTGTAKKNILKKDAKEHTGTAKRGRPKKDAKVFHSDTGQPVEKAKLLDSNTRLQKQKNAEITKAPPINKKSRTKAPESKENASPVNTTMSLRKTLLSLESISNKRVMRNTTAESVDSGITDINETCVSQNKNENRMAETIDDISKIYPDPSEGTVLKDNTFKVPELIPKKFTRMQLSATRMQVSVEPTLDQIVEETEKDSSSHSTQDESYETPKKNNTIVKSRLLDLGTPKGSQSMAKKESDGISSRRSGRIRTKPLAFWDFEKAVVNRLESGELSIVYSKEDDPITKARRKLLNDESSNKDSHPSSKRLSQSLQSFNRAKTRRLLDNSQQQLPVNKRKIHVSQDRNPKPTKKLKTSSKNSAEENPFSNHISFSSLRFIPWSTKEFTAFLARGFVSKELDVYSGMLYLSHGKMVWTTTKYMTIFVISGKGSLNVVESSEDGLLIALEPKVKTTVAIDKKVVLEKEDDGQLLKLNILLQSRGC